MVVYIYDNNRLPTEHLQCFLNGKLLDAKYQCKHAEMKMDTSLTDIHIFTPHDIGRYFM